MLRWPDWEPTVRANLCFIIRERELLLIRKKRGLGAGKVNGPGGKVEPGETALESTVREVFEELCVTPLHPERIGQLYFEFRDGCRLHCEVFVAERFSGEPQETEEAVPLWTRFDAIPYDEMWEDDRYWLPFVIARQPFRACFRFDGDRLLERRVEAFETASIR
jgi:8-oxo-dGTP diphosphatase